MGRLVGPETFVRGTGQAYGAAFLACRFRTRFKTRLGRPKREHLVPQEELTGVGLVGNARLQPLLPLVVMRRWLDRLGTWPVRLVSTSQPSYSRVRTGNWLSRPCVAGWD